MAKTYIEKMQDAGVAIREYKRVPSYSGKDTFILNNSGKTLMVWPGLATIAVAVSKRHKQAVLNVTEEARKVTQTFEMPGERLSRYGDEAKRIENPPLDLFDDSDIADYFPIVFPDDANIRWKVNAIKDVTDFSDGGPGNPYRREYEVTATAHVAATKQAFLVGLDETEQFVSMLPQQVKSVAEAHEVLKPKGLRKGWLRQGEFFFNPPTDERRVELDNYITKHPSALDIEPTALQKDAGGWNEDSSHYAVTLDYKGKTYAIGFVTDREEGSGWYPTPSKPRHHAPLWLNDWYEVLRNRELPAPESATNWD